MYIYSYTITYQSRGIEILWALAHAVSCETWSSCYPLPSIDFCSTLVQSIEAPGSSHSRWSNPDCQVSPGLPFKLTFQNIYKVEKQNLQVAKLVNFEHVNKNMAQNSSPACKHTLFALFKAQSCLLSAQAYENLQKGSGSQNCLVPIQNRKMGVLQQEIKYLKHAARYLTFYHQIIWGQMSLKR